MSKTKRVAIAAGAGFCLAFARVVAVGLKLDPGELGDWLFQALQGSLLLAVLLAVIVIIFAFFMFKSENKPKRLFRDCLLVPAILMNFFPASSISPGQQDEGLPVLRNEIKDFDADRIGGLFGGMGTLALAPVYAQDTIDLRDTLLDTSHIRTRPYLGGLNIEVIKKSDIEKGPFDYALQMIGRRTSLKPYVYIVGKTTDSARAISLAGQLREIPQVGEDISLFRFNGQDEIYISVGPRGTLEQIVAVEKSLKRELKRDSLDVDARHIKSVLHGQIIDLRKLRKR